MNNSNVNESLSQSPKNSGLQESGQKSAVPQSPQNKQQTETADQIENAQQEEP